MFCMKMLLLPIVFLLFLSIPAFAMDGNVLWLKFENNYDDSSSFAQTAYPYGDVNFVSGKVGNGLHFDGDFDYLLVNNSESMNFGEGNFTIDFWMRYDSESLGVFQKLDSTEIPEEPYVISSGWFAEIQGGELDEMSFAFVGQNITFAGQNNYLFLYTALTPSERYGEWHHRVIMRNGTGCNDIYGFIDGIDVMNKAASSENCSLNVSSSSDLFLGTAWQGEYPPTSNFFDGTLDEFRLWNRALNDTEISNLYQYNSLESPPPAEPDQTLLMFEPLILLVIGVGLSLFVFKQFREGELSMNKLIGIVLTVVIAMAFIITISGIA